MKDLQLLLCAQSHTRKLRHESSKQLLLLLLLLLVLSHLLWHGQQHAL